jgi:hypothetical protein
MISPHQLIVQLLDTRLKVGILQEKLSVAPLNVRDGTDLGLHLVGVLFQVEAMVSARSRDLQKQGAHMLGVACREHPTRMVGWKLGVANGDCSHRNLMDHVEQDKTLSHKVSLDVFLFKPTKGNESN